MRVIEIPFKIDGETFRLLCKISDPYINRKVRSKTGIPTDDMKAYFKEYYQTNKHKYVNRYDKKKYNKEYYIKTKEQKLEARQKYYKANKEKIKATAKAYYEKNREVINEQNKSRNKERRKELKS